MGEINEVGGAVNAEEVAEQQSKLGVHLTFMSGRDGINTMEAELEITFSVKQKSMALILLRGEISPSFEPYFRKKAQF